MNEPRPAPPPRSRGPLFLALGCLALVALGGCGTLAVLFLLGALVAAAPEPPGPAPVAPAPVAPAPVGAADAEGWVQTVTMADLAGEWRTGAATVTDHVDRQTGDYRGTSTSFYGVTYWLQGDGSWTSKFLGRDGGQTIREEDAGTWTLEGSKLVLASQSGRRFAWWFLGWRPEPAGESQLRVLDEDYPVTDGAMLYRETWVRVAK